MCICVEGVLLEGWIALESSDEVEDVCAAVLHHARRVSPPTSQVADGQVTKIHQCGISLGFRPERLHGADKPL